MEKYGNGRAGGIGGGVHGGGGGKVATRKAAAPALPPRRLETVLEQACICNRPSTQVVCRTCSYINQKARAYRPCTVHPRTLYLSDMKVCPTCHSKDLVEMM